RPGPVRAVPAARRPAPPPACVQRAEADEWPGEDLCPHEPQLEGLVAREVSQPSAWMLPLQSAHPAAHVPRHTPPRGVAAQDGVTWFVEHLIPQPPQLFTSLPLYVSQPSDHLLRLQS